MADLRGRGHQPERAGGGDVSRRAADGATRETAGGQEDQHAGQDEKPFRRLLVTVQDAAGDDALDAVLLRFAGLRCHPRAQRQRRREREGYCPCPTGCSAFPDSPQRYDRGDWE